jgi:hypothetical protein
MIEIIFSLASEVVLVVIDGNDIKFGSTTYGAQLADISGLKLDYAGTIREFPDLETDPDWQQEAIRRFKEHIKSLETENEKCDYIIKELEACGYTAKSKRRKGHRPITLK